MKEKIVLFHFEFIEFIEIYDKRKNVGLSRLITIHKNRIFFHLIEKEIRSF